VGVRRARAVNSQSFNGAIAPRMLQYSGLSGRSKLGWVSLMVNTNGRRAVLRATDLTKDLPLGPVVVHAVRGVNLTIYENEMVSIVGPSGSGKSTLLGLIGGLDTPTTGRIEIDGVDITNMSEGRLSEVRNEKIGFVFQFFNLIPTLTALENVALPIEFANNPKFDPEKRAKELLHLLGT